MQETLDTGPIGLRINNDGLDMTCFGNPEKCLRAGCRLIQGRHHPGRDEIIGLSMDKQGRGL